MASTRQKPRVVSDPEPEYEPIVGDPLPPNVHISASARPSDSSTGLIIAALIVVLGILFVLSFDWTGTSTGPAVTQNSTAPATPDATAPATPVPSTPPAAEAPSPPATPPEPTTTTQ
jgi:hypothetical protein